VAPGYVRVQVVDTLGFVVTKRAFKDSFFATVEPPVSPEALVPLKGLPADFAEVSRSLAIARVLGSSSRRSSTASRGVSVKVVDEELVLSSLRATRDLSHSRLVTARRLQILMRRISGHVLVTGVGET